MHCRRYALANASSGNFHQADVNVNRNRQQAAIGQFIKQNYLRV